MVLRMFLSYKETSGSIDVNWVDEELLDSNITKVIYKTTNFDFLLDTF